MSFIYNIFVIASGPGNYEILLLKFFFQEAKERDIEFDQESGYSSNSPNSSPSSEIFGSRDESSRDASSSTTTETSVEASSPGPTSSCSSSTTSSPIAVMKTLQTPTLTTRPTLTGTQGATQIVEVKKRPIFGTIQTKNGPVVIKAVLPAGTLAKKSLVFKQAAQSILWRNVKFSVKYFGKEVRSWSFREKAMCRLTSEKKPMDVKYPNPIYNEKKMFKVGCST